MDWTHATDPFYRAILADIADTEWQIVEQNFRDNMKSISHSGWAWHADSDEQWSCQLGTSLRYVVKHFPAEQRWEAWLHHAYGESIICRGNDHLQQAFLACYTHFDHMTLGLVP